MSRPQVTVQFLRHILDCVELTGCSADPLLERFGIAKHAMGDRDATIPLADFVALFEQAAELSGNPSFGLQAGRLVGSDSLGALSFLFLAAPTLGEAFGALSRHISAMQQASLCAFDVEGDKASLIYRVTDPDVGMKNQDAEYSISATHALAANYCSGNFTLNEVCFEHEMIADYARYRDHFGCEVFFEQPKNSLTFSSRQTGYRGNLLSSELYPILVDHLRQKEQQEQGFEGDLLTGVSSWLHRQDISRPLLLQDAASDLGLSRSSLQRGLRESNSGWRQLVAAHRIEIAKRLLCESTRSIADIALCTGYAESASFTRAFQAQTGITPSRYRKETRR